MVVFPRLVVNTHIHLSNINFKSKKQGRGKIYWAAITKEEFEQAKAKRILDVLYQGSIKNFLTALYGGKTVSTEEIEDLKKWLSEDRK